MRLSIAEGEKRGRPVHPSQQAILDEVPPLDAAMVIVLEAWRDLETCRPIGMMAGPIPWTVMREWCRVEELDSEASGVLVAALSYVDREDFAKRAAKQKQPAGSGGRR